MHAVPPPKAIGRLLYKSYIVIGHVRPSCLEIMQQDTLQQSGKTTRQSRMYCVRTAYVLMQTWRDRLERMYKVQLAEFTFKCLKGYNVTELIDQRNSSCESRRKVEIVLPIPETNSMRNSIKYGGAIAWNCLSSKESAANN